MADLNDSLSLQEYVSCLSLSALPRIVRVCSGVYFQGSIYEISGNEVSLSTGDLVKIISFELQKVTCVDSHSGTSVDLPLNFSGHFGLIPDMVYSSIEEIGNKFTNCKDRQSFSFASKVDLMFNKHLIKALEPILWRGLSSDCKYAKCITREEYGNVCIKIPLTLKGEFYECEEEQKVYSLSEILQSTVLLKQRLTCSIVSRHSFVLTPVYEVQAIMQLRPNIVKIPSHLEVDVIDVTSECKDVKFIQTQMLHQVLEHEDDFPVVAELLDAPEPITLFKNGWVASLQKGEKIIFHEKASSLKILTSSMKGKKEGRYFLISSNYKGKFKRRPREFATAYDLLSCLKTDLKLRVVVTKDCDCYEEEFPSLCVGDRLNVDSRMNMIDSVDGAAQQTDVVVCTRQCDDEEGEKDEFEEIMLPLHVEGRFVEEITDNRRYTINDIVEKFKLPCDFKVVVKDSTMPNDILGSFTYLRLEEIIEVPFIVSSLLSEPDICFDIPLTWFNVSLFFTEDSPAVPKKRTSISIVEEVMDSFYYNLRKLLPSNGPPPPRPPKRQSLKKPATPMEAHKKTPRQV
ncbi:protein THEMIS2 isoform X2 [Ambystoma mexicanum]|uniref:protein THEMIS2 isoform X2 n=1 Tax=Ambystoma mexicanum TaxID=8296 RepID=UPI0037E74285